MQKARKVTAALAIASASSNLPENPLDLFDEVTGEYFILFPIAAFTAICLLSLLRLYEDAALLTQFLPQLVLLFALVFVLLFSYLAIRRNRKLIRIETGVDKEAVRNLSLQVIDSHRAGVLSRIVKPARWLPQPRRSHGAAKS